MQEPNQVKTTVELSDLRDLDKLADVFKVSRSAIIRACVIYCLNVKRQNFIRFLDINAKLYK